MDALFSGSGEIRAVCRSIDWSATPLGQAEGWPRALRAVVRLCLDSKTPMAIWAGPEFTLVYNEGYSAVLGSKHPWAMGRPAREVWSEVWDALGPEFQQAMEHGTATRHEEARFRLQRGGAEDDAYFVYSLTPIRDDDGHIVGLFNVLQETTSSVKAQAESEEFLAFALANAATGAWDLDEVDGTAHRTIQHDRIFGYDELLPEWTFAMFLDHVLPEHREEVASSFRHSAETRTGWSFECRIRRRDGEIRWIWAAGRHLDGTGNRHRRIAGIVQDITPRKTAEQALRASEERFRTVVDNSRDGINMLDLESGLYVFMSPAQVELTGFTADEINNLSSQKALERVHPDDRVISLRQQEDIVAGHDLPAPVEYRWKVKSGEYRWFSDSRKLVRDPHGRPVALVGVSRDITDRKQDEEALRESRTRLEQERARLQAIIDTIPVGLFVVEASGRVAVMNDEAKRIWGGTVPLETVGDDAEYKGSWPDTGVPLKAEEWPAAQALLAGRHTKDCVVDIEKFDGTRGTIVFAGAPIKDAHGVTAGAVVAIQDISELREAKARLEDADRRKSHFLAVLSHELRNPLAPIKNSLYILDRSAPGGDQARRARDVIERQIDQLSHLVDDLLDVTRIARGKVQLQHRRLELNDLVRRTLEDHRALFESCGLHVHLEPAPQQVFIHADWHRIAQVLSNLLQNAAKFTPRGGRVSVKVGQDASARRGVVRVLDNGAGMTPDMLARLFEPFMQADTTLERSKGGLGLGLALVKGLVEQHGGSVEASSAGVGQGAEFVVRLPLDLTAPSDGERHQPAAVSARRRVLVVEDNIDAAATLADVLQMHGHEVAVAHDGYEGIAAARRFRPDFVLCDIGLPGMDGYAVARACREDDALKQTHLVALSGYALPEDLQRAAAAGFERHLAKPPNLDLLAKILDEMPGD